ncbi:hypothetical protein VU07_00055 [Desulfobulbus sp. F4]|nr:hypothetical protein [Desulfobulbus sp. F3]MCW5200205.1 hypothetical protein [Desulfobulbus sp. F4]
MRADEYTCWKDGDFYLGYLNDYPDYQTQGYSKEELIANLQNLRNDIDMKDEYDFTDAEQGKFYTPIEEIDIPQNKAADSQLRGILKGKEGGPELFMQDKQAEIEKEEIYRRS